MAAATEAFREVGPEGVTVRDIAARAQVSHGLVMHYFGSYEELVRAVLARRRERALSSLMEQLSALGNADADPAILDLALDFLLDPVRRRLRAWLDARGSEPTQRARLGMLTQLATLYLNRVRAAHGKAPLASQTVEDLVLVLQSAAQGFPNTPSALRQDSEQRFRGTLRAMVQAYLLQQP